MAAIKKVGMRIPVDLHARLVQVSQDDKRSLHAEVLEILESWFDVHRLRYRLAELERHAVTPVTPTDDA